MVSNRACNSIYAVYRSQTQIITRVNAAHSLPCFAIAKINKNFGFCKFFFSHLVICQNGSCCSLLQLLQLVLQRERAKNGFLLSQGVPPPPGGTVGQSFFISAIFLSKKFSFSSVIQRKSLNLPPTNKTKSLTKNNSE